MTQTDYAAASPIKPDVGPTVRLVGRPRYEGANIRSWIGFKHFYFLVEEVVLEWFRYHGFGPQRLFERHGLGIELLDSTISLPAVIEMDDVVTAEAQHLEAGRFNVRLGVEREGQTVTALKGRVTAGLVREAQAPGTASHPAPERLSGLILQGNGSAYRAARATSQADSPSPLAADDFCWRWRARYFLCHYSDRVQHSAYVRALEETVARFLEERGLSVGRMLDSHGWIPVVSRARIQQLADAHMEETIHTTFAVEDVFKRTAFAGRMDCYVMRDDGPVHTATARIVHGYAVTRGPSTGRLATFDDATVAALTGGVAR